LDFYPILGKQVLALLVNARKLFRVEGFSWDVHQFLSKDE